MRNAPETLKKRLRDGHVIPFVGAGVSMAVRQQGTSKRLFPGWRELLLLAADQLEAENKLPHAQVVRYLLEFDPPDYLDAARRARDGLSAVWFEFLKEHLNPSRTQVDDESLNLARAIWRLGSRLVITTNYDRVLEWACPGQDDLVSWDIQSPVEQAKVLREGTRSPTVWHLHGHIANAANIILTRDGYDLLYPEAREGEVKGTYDAALKTLHYLISSRTFLFVGFSLDDAYFGMQLSGIDEIFKGGTGPHYVLAREADQQRVKSLSLPVEVIKFTDFDALLNLVQELGSTSQTRIVVNEKEIPPQEDISLTVRPADYGPYHSVFFVPYREKGAQVIGREDALQAVRKQLTEGFRTSIGQTAAFQGLGGLGKTQLAVEYAYRYKDEYPNGVIWLTADQDIDAQLIELSEKARWVAPESEHKYKLEIAQQRLRSYSGCLIVFDNLEEKSKIGPYLPEPQATPHILVTSRTEQPDFFPIPLNLLDESLSQELLIQEAQRKPEGDAEKTAALDIVKTLEGLPLALELAGAYLRFRQEVSFQKYHEFLNLNLRKALPGNLSSFTKHEADLYHTLKINEEVLKEDDKLRDVLDLLTWSGSAPMDESLMCALLGIENSVELRNALSLGTALRLLQKGPNADSYAIHRLVREVRREEISLAERSKWVGNICQRIGDWFDKRREEFSALPQFESEIDHLRAWQNHTKDFAPEHASRLLWLQAYPPYHRGRFRESKDLIEKALKIFNETKKRDRQLEAHLLSDLGYCYDSLGDYQLRLEYAEKALAIRLELFGEQHSDTATSFNNIGTIYLESGDYKRALEYAEKALAIQQKLFGEHHPNTPASFNNIGMIYLESGDYKRALEYIEKALVIYLELFGEHHPRTATLFGNSGIIYGKLGNRKQELEYKSKALSLRRELLGDQHPDTLQSADSLAYVLCKSGRARPAFELLDSLWRKLPLDHPQYIWLTQKRLAARNLCPGFRQTPGSNQKRQKKNRKKR